jgi:hypothetical protein
MSVAVSQHKNFVGGEWVDSSSAETMEVLNPSTGEVIAEVARGRHRLDQRPHSAHGRDAARRLQGVGLRQDLSVYSLEDYTQIKHVMAKID